MKRKLNSSKYHSVGECEWCGKQFVVLFSSKEEKDLWDQWQLSDLNLEWTDLVCSDKCQQKLFDTYPAE